MEPRKCVPIIDCGFPASQDNNSPTHANDKVLTRCQIQINHQIEFH